MFRLAAIALTVLGLSCFLAYESANANGSANGDASALESFVGQADFEKLTPRLEALNYDIASNGLHDFPEADGKMLTGYAYGEFFDWDLYFENVYLSYYGVNTYDFTNFKVFLDRQQPDGFVSRTIGIKFPRPRQMFKPFLAQLAVLGTKQNGDNYEWLRARYYERLQKYLDRWFAYDTDGNGLPVWNSSDASGMDNQISRSGQPDSYFDEGVDLACYLYRELEAMQFIAEKLGKPDDAKAYAKHARRLAAAINRVFWDEKDGFYYDRNQKTGESIRVKSVAGFMPLGRDRVTRAGPAASARASDESARVLAQVSGGHLCHDGAGFLRGHKGRMQLARAGVDSDELHDSARAHGLRIRGGGPGACAEDV